MLIPKGIYWILGALLIVCLAQLRITVNMTAHLYCICTPPAHQCLETIAINLFNEPAHLYPIWVSLSNIHASTLTCPVPMA